MVARTMLCPLASSLVAVLVRSDETNLVVVDMHMIERLDYSQKSKSSAAPHPGTYVLGLYVPYVHSSVF